MQTANHGTNRSRHTDRIGAEAAALRRAIPRFTRGAWGLYAAQEMGAGEVVWALSGETSRTPTRTSIRVGPGVHVEDTIGIRMNHACRPSVRISGRDVVALRDLAVGDELTFDYRDTESPVSHPFVCGCCGRMIESA